MTEAAANIPGEKIPSPRRNQAMDALLARVAAAGDREAFGELYEYFTPRLKAYLIRIGSSGELAEDLVQETMVKVWRKARLYDPAKAAAATWIYTIARNQRIDALRRLNKPDLPQDDPSITPDDEPQPDENVERNERDAIIRKAYDALPPNQQAVVALHFYEDEPHSAIAERLGLPLGTVKSRLRLAFEKIRRELGEL